MLAALGSRLWKLFAGTTQISSFKSLQRLTSLGIIVRRRELLHSKRQVVSTRVFQIQARKRCHAGRRERGVALVRGHGAGVAGCRGEELTVAAPGARRAFQVGGSPSSQSCAQPPSTRACACVNAGMVGSGPAGAAGRGSTGADCC